jgi:hypothetical protein
MIIERFPEIQKLTEPEKFQLYDELGHLLATDEPVTDPDILAVLEHRHAEYLNDPSSARPWSEVRDRLRKKYLSSERSSE